ncbi:MAG: HNH endonuclease domain-containing protein [Microcoleaceae cyanobacterium]
MEILANAWYPHTYFKLSFGSQDQIANKLDSLELDINEPILKFTDTDKKNLRKIIQSQNIDDIVSLISRYVTYRLIRPFFEQETKGLKDSNVNQNLISLANNQFDKKKPLYCFNSEEKRKCNAINLHQSWIEYIEENYSIVWIWTAWEWLGYMQKRNPSTPTLVNKLFIPSKREYLTKQKEYWKKVLEKHQETRCIYSNQIVNKSRFSLDHYLPWSFVAHDQLWNLVPVVPDINSSKSNNLPSQEYFNNFIQIQHLGLITSHQFMKKSDWEKYVEPYASDLKLSYENLLDIDKLRNAYEATIIPLISLAKNQGFSTEWYLSS